MSFSQQSSPNIKLELKPPANNPYHLSPGVQKRMHPFSLDQSQASLKNSMIVNEELEFYKQRSADLEQYVRQLKSELDSTVQRLSKNGQIDEKVELVLKQNQALSIEYDRLQKQNAQRKTECDIWKTKYEQQLHSSVQLKAGYEQDIRDLSHQIRQLEDKNDLLEQERLRETDRLHSFNEQHRHQYQSQIEVLEGQIRKLRVFAEDQEKENYEMQARLERAKNESDREQSRLQKDIEILRQKLQEKEMETQRDMGNLRSKLEILNQGALENMKGQFTTQIDILEGEVQNIKELLDIKNTEIETLIVQNQKQKANYDEEINTVRMQFDILKDKMLENEQHFDEGLQRVHDRLTNQHEKEILQLQNEKIQQRQIHDQEVQKLNDKLEQGMRYQTNLDNQRKDELERAFDRFNQQLQAMQEFSDQQRNQIETMRQENLYLQHNLIIKQQEIDVVIEQFSSIRKKLDEDYRRLRQEYEELYLHQQTQEHTLKKKIVELNNQINNQQSQLQELKQFHENFVENSNRHQRNLEDELNRKDDECSSLLNQKQQLERELRKLKEDAAILRTQMSQQETKSKNHHEEFKMNSAIQTEAALEELRGAHAAQIQILHQELSQLRTSLEMKTKGYYDMTEKLQQIERSLQDIRINPTEQKVLSLSTEIKVTRSLQS